MSGYGQNEPTKRGIANIRKANGKKSIWRFIYIASLILLESGYSPAWAADHCQTLAEKYRLAKIKAEDTPLNNTPDYYEVSSKLMEPAFDTNDPFGKYIASRYATFVQLLPKTDHEIYVRAVHRSACIALLKSLNENPQTPIVPPSGEVLVEMIDRIEAILQRQAQ